LLENLVHAGIYNTFKDTSFHPIFYLTKVVSITLGAIVSIYAYKFYKIIHSNVLLGIILSFGLMSFTDVFVMLYLPTINNPELFNLFFWLRLFTMSFAFAFLALAYLISSYEGKRTGLVLKISMLSTIPIISTVLAVWFFNNSSLPTVTDYDSYFRIFNICALVYVISMSFKNSIFTSRKEFVFIPIAYGVFLIGQVSLLIFSLQGSFSSVATSFVAKDVGLVIFVKIMHSANRRRPSLKELKPHSGDKR
jgi:hypothetical protein